MNLRLKAFSSLSILAVTAVAFCLSFTPAIAGIVVWSPAQTTTIGWYDASDSNNVVTSGAANNVDSWNDISGNGYHLNQNPGGGNRPVYNGQQINGLNVINLDSTSDQLYRTGIPDINLTQLTVISIGMPQLPGDYPNLGRVRSTGGADSLNLRLRNDATQGSVSSTVRLDGTSFSMSSSNNTIIRDNEPVMLGVHYDGLNAVSRVNGGTITSTRADATDGATFTINEIQMGRDSNTPRNYHGEMIILPTADIDTIEMVEGYLAWKWEMEASLPATHTYRFAAPTPEPSTALLSGLGLMSLLIRRRR